ncbi:MAG TPA: zinc-binding dehydrogenase [Microbacterium sp.]|nr:zinc-binding dehydrogenase [Microbacterium sp.]
MAVTGNTTQGPDEVHQEIPDAATAWWSVAPGRGEFRGEPVPDVSDGEAAVRTLYTGVSRGTESLVARGEVPTSERERMRAPFQAGDFPFPVKYGYLNVGTVERGPAALLGRTVFSLFPHQSRFVVPADALHPVPESVPARRAVLAGAVETAVNVLWDAAPLVGDRVVVVGAGMVGCAIARLARSIPGSDVTLVDVDPARAATAEALGVGFALASEEIPQADVVIEASGAPGQLDAAIALARPGGTVLQVGIPAAPQEIDVHSLVMREIGIRTTLAHVCGEDLAPALDLLAGTSLAAELLDGVHPLGAVAEQLDRLSSGRLDGKVLIDPSLEG